MLSNGVIREHKIPKRVNLCNYVNKHGESFIEFLKDCKFRFFIWENLSTKTYLYQVPTSNPKCFWNVKNKLRPKPIMKIDMEVLSSDGTVILKTSLVMKRWENDLIGLFTTCGNEFDDTFYLNIYSTKCHIKSNVLRMESCANEKLQVLEVYLLNY